MKDNLLEVHNIEGIGYDHVVDYQSWAVAKLTYIDELEVDNLETMQKHNESDEVFVLLDGEFTLFLGGNGEHIGDIEAVKLEPLKVYNVKAGTYHTHVTEKNSKVLIVENRDTGDDNSPEEDLTKEQLATIKKLYEKVNGK